MRGEIVAIHSGRAGDPTGKAAVAPPPGARIPTTCHSCLVLLRPGAGTPLFIAHGLAGSVMELRDLGRRLHTDGAVYGIEAPGLDGVATPLERIEDMAVYYLREIRRVQPVGPYRLAGFSIGGLVVLEMAQQLTRAGETVAFLGLLDTYPHPRFWPLRCRIAAWWKLAGAWLSASMWQRIWRHYVDELRDLPPAARPAYLARRLRGLARLPFNLLFLRRFVAQQDVPAPDEPVVTPAAEQVRLAGLAALADYCPLAYPGEIVFFKAADETNLPFEAKLLWRSLARGITVHAVPGSHSGLVRGGVAALSAALSAALAAAAASAVGSGHGG